MHDSANIHILQCIKVDPFIYYPQYSNTDDSFHYCNEQIHSKKDKYIK